MTVTIKPGGVDRDERIEKSRKHESPAPSDPEQGGKTDQSANWLSMDVQVVAKAYGSCRYNTFLY